MKARSVPVNPAKIRSLRAAGRAAIILSLMMLVLSSAGHAAYGLGSQGCEPAIDEARAKLERLFGSAYVTPHTLVSLEKRDGRRLETRGRRIYQMRFVAVLNYSGDRLRCRKHLCPELHNYLVEVDAAAKKATIAGWLFFEQGPDGWR